MDVLVLYYRDEPLREFPLRARSLEVGRGAGCDIVVHDPDVRERHLLVAARGGTVVVHDLEGDGATAERPLPPNEPLPIGRRHAIVRLPNAAAAPRGRKGKTEPLVHLAAAGHDLSLVVGRGADARRVPIGPRPLTVGSGPGNELVLSDRAVSARHCRFEPSADGLRVRDLASRNGTGVDGVQVTLARVDAGSTIRVGRTDLRVVARGRPGDARQSGLVAESPEMQEVLESVERFARVDWPVLITGESGAGKEGVARALHLRGSDPEAPFVAINAGGLPRSLVESELFGHEKGAFTGASGQRRGVFEQADGGTLFLDEIGELPLELQARLLRVLETFRVRRLGSERTVAVRVRLVCATHRNLAALVEAGRFRQDLYYRIAQLGIHVPPLRERPRDIEALAALFLAQAAEQLGPRRFGAGALERLLWHEWPGNARELRNVIRAAAARSAGAWITAEDVGAALGPAAAGRHLEQERLREVLEQHDGNLTAAARAVGLPRTTFRDRLRRGDEAERRRAS